MNLYEILDVDCTATQYDIKKSYKNLARKFHPDKNKDDSALNKFKDINMAYEILSDNEKKQKYDSMSQIEQYEFYDMIKSAISKIDPSGIKIVDNVINFFYEDENILKSEMNELNFVGIFSRIQSKLQNSSIIDIGKFLQSIDNGYTKKTINKKNIENSHDDMDIDIDMETNFDPNIKLDIVTSLKDRYLNKFKKLVYNTNNNQSDVVYVPLYGNEMIFPNKGNYYEGDNRGNLYITVETNNHETIKIINDVDLVVFLKLSLYEYLYGTNFEYDLFGDKISINIPSCIDVIPIIKIDGKGLPYKKIDSDDEYVDINLKNELSRGDFYVYLQIDNIIDFKSHIKDIFPPLNRDD